MLIEPKTSEFTIAKQCKLLGLPKSTLYYKPLGETSENLIVMRAIDEIYTKCPFYGRRRMVVNINKNYDLGFKVNKKRVGRLMDNMCIQAIYPKPNLSKPGKGHLIYPYLLRGVKIVHPNQVWATDVTYVRMNNGFLYLIVIMDWFSRHVISWELSNTMDVNFCIRALEKALATEKPIMFNSDQGSQFTSNAFTGVLKKYAIDISMNGKGRCHDNIFVERLWRTVKQEEIYLNDYLTVQEAAHRIGKYFEYYNFKRYHQSLDYNTPFDVYQKGEIC